MCAPQMLIVLQIKSISLRHQIPKLIYSLTRASQCSPQLMCAAYGRTFLHGKSPNNTIKLIDPVCPSNWSLIRALLNSPLREQRRQFRRTLRRLRRCMQHSQRQKSQKFSSP